MELRRVGWWPLATTAVAAAMLLSWIPGVAVGATPRLDGRLLTQTPTQTENAVPAPDPAPGQGLSAAVAAVPASSVELDAAEVERDRLLARQSAATDELERTVADLGSVDTERVALVGLVARRDEQITKADEALVQLHADLRAVAIEWFITGFDITKTLDPTLSSAERDQLNRGRVLSETAAEDTIADERFASTHLSSLRSERSTLDTRRRDAEDRSAELATRRDQLTAELSSLTEKLTANEQRVAEAKMTATIDGTDLSTGALDAYWRASQTLASVDPRCGLTWWALAGIGRTESRHGTYRGASVARDGTVSPPIYGPELDGSNTFAVVPDSDGGRLDATSTTDRAVGPMQFLPSTWKVVGRDGSGDGVADPQNLYDAALGAGVYLCRSGPDLSQLPRLQGAYLRYNRSQQYVDIVTGYAQGYASAVDLPG